MKSKQVLNVQQMQHLEELGLELDYTTMLSWIIDNRGKDKPLLCISSEAVDYVDFRHYCLPAYTLQDVLDALPEKQHITFKSNNEDVTELCDLALSKNTVWYECDIRQPGIILDYWEKEAVISYSAENLIDAAYSMLCWAIENGYVETNKNK